MTSMCTSSNTTNVQPSRDSLGKITWEKDFLSQDKISDILIRCARRNFNPIPISEFSQFICIIPFMGDFKNNASISLINVYRLSKADLLLKLILSYVINVFLASCQVSSL